MPDEEGAHLLLRVKILGFKLELFAGFTGLIWPAVLGQLRRILGLPDVARQQQGIESNAGVAGQIAGSPDRPEGIAFNAVTRPSEQAILPNSPPLP